ncbi:MAG: ParB/RepB/Spo0J family partition protein [Verrucomicrobiota bacterium]
MKSISKTQMAAMAAQASTKSITLEERQSGSLLSRAKQAALDSHPLEHDSPEPPPAAPVTDAGGNLPETGSAASNSRLEQVPVSLIDPNPYNARKIYRTERVSELAASIGAHGQEIPGVATIRDGRYILAAGHYRLRALKVIGAQNMALMVREGLTDRDLYEQSFRENSQRESQSALDNAISWKALLDQGVYGSETEIAEITGISLPNVNKTLSILRLSSPVITLVSEDPDKFAMSVLYELALYEECAGPERALAMAHMVQSEKIGRKEINEARQSLVSPKKRKTKEISRQHKITQQGVQIGSIKEWDSGKVTLEVTLVDPQHRSALVNELRSRFGSQE